MTQISIEAQSAGYDFGNAASIKVDGVDLSGGTYKRGLNVAAVNQITGKKIWFQTFDTYLNETESDSFAKAIEGLPIGCLVIIGVMDEAANHLNDRAKRACQLVGSSQIYNLGWRNSWAIIGQKGAAPGTVNEGLANNGSVSLQRQFDLQSPSDAGLWIEATSAGYDVGNSASISINGTVVNVTGGYKRGLNVVVLDEISGAVLQTQNFDTYIHAYPTQADAFAELIESLPTGRLVAVAVKDDATTNLTERAKQACESLGSTAIRQLAYRGSWAIIGSKDNIDGSVAESLANTSQASSCYWFRPATEEGLNYFSVTTQSAGYKFGDTAGIYVDGLPILADSSIKGGFNVVAIDQDTGIVTATGNFDVDSGPEQGFALASFIDDIEVGTLVAIAVKDDGATNLSDTARRALQSVGSALIHNLELQNTFTMVGRKGSAPGSVPEILKSDGPASFTLRFELTAQSCKPFHSISVASAGYSFGNSAEIRIHGQPVTMPNGYQRGLNVVMLDRVGCAHSSHHFDTYADPAQSDAFAQLVENASDGQIIAVAVKDEASRNLTERAKKACESIGSTKIRQLGCRGSWAVIGKKGTATGAVCEVMSNTAAVSGHDWITCKIEPSEGFNLVAYSAGFNAGNAATIIKDGIPVAVDGGYQRGLNVLIFDQATGAITSARNYDTYTSSTAADALAQAIESLPVGCIVAVVVMDEASSQLSERAKKALASVGSSRIYDLGYRGSWSLIGYKGAAPGSAIEELDSSGVVAVRMWVPYFSTSATEKRFFGVLIAMVVVAVAVVTAEIVYTTTLPSPPTVAMLPPPTTRRRALLVGIDYEGFGNLYLKGRASKKIGDLRRLLVNGYFFKDREVLLVVEDAIQGPNFSPSLSSIRNAITDWLVNGAADGDVLYFHFLGHGNRDLTDLNNIYEYLIVLSDNLQSRTIIRDSDFQALVRNVPTGVNLTLVFHCCFGGGMVDASDAGRGIALAAADSDTPAVLQKVDLTTAICNRLELTRSGTRQPTLTYTEMLDYVIANQDKDLPTPVLRANPEIYNVNVATYLNPIV